MKTPTQCIEKIKENLKKDTKITQPEWSLFIKTGVNTERPPSQPDWWFMREAAVLRKISIHGPVGVSRLRTAYGGKKRRGHKRAHRKDAGGKIIRTMLQQLEKTGYIKSVEKPKRGRVVTPKGQSLVDRCGK